MRDVTFISDRELLVYLPERRSLQIVTVDDPDLETDSPAHLRAVFYLPEAKRGYVYMNASFREHPFCGSKGEYLVRSIVVVQCLTTM